MSLQRSGCLVRAFDPKEGILDQPVDVSKGLWKYALLVMVQRPQVEISTSSLISELSSYIAVPEDAGKLNSSRGDSAFSQLVRNLKSHKDSPSNFITKGYAEDIANGFKAASKSRNFVLTHFVARLGKDVSDANGWE